MLGKNSERLYLRGTEDWRISMPKKKNEITIHSSAAEYLTYVAAVGDSADSMEMRYEEENIWLTQKMMAQLYDVDVRTIKRSSLRSPIAEKKSRRVRKRRSLRDFIVSTNRETAAKVVMVLDLPSQKAS